MEHSPVNSQIRNFHKPFCTLEALWSTALGFFRSEHFINNFLLLEQYAPPLDDFSEKIVPWMHKHNLFNDISLNIFGPFPIQACQTMYICQNINHPAAEVFNTLNSDIDRGQAPGSSSWQTVFHTGCRCCWIPQSCELLVCVASGCHFPVMAYLAMAITESMEKSGRSSTAPAWCSRSTAWALQRSSLV